MKILRMLILAVVSVFVAAFTSVAQSVPSPENAKSPTVNEIYPGLASGGLTYAKLGDLPGGTLLQCGSTRLTAKDLDDAIEKAPEAMRDGLRKNGLFILEQMATKQIILEMAKRQAAETKKDIVAKSEKDILGDYIQGVVGAIQVTDEQVTKFYEENKDSCGGATLEQVKDELKQYVSQQKQQEAVDEHVRTLGQRLPITVSAAWAKAQDASAKDNPVDKARGSGKPTMVDFGASGCRPCDMMTPILADLKKKYESKANVLFVHVREEQILASRYHIQTIPAQVFFDKDGKEVSRHTGFFPQADIEKKLAEMGAQ